MRLAIIVSLALLMANAAEAQNLQLVCKVRWDQRCNDAMLKFRECPPELRAETNEGTIEIAGNKARTENLGAVTGYAVTKRSANEFELNGQSQGMRGWGVLDSATWKLKLVFTVGGLSGGSGGPGSLQRGLEGECG
jgi:hypothetical protein